jgi:hypothetical protein
VALGQHHTGDELIATAPSTVGALQLMSRGSCRASQAWRRRRNSTGRCVWCRARAPPGEKLGEAPGVFGPSTQSLGQNWARHLASEPDQNQERR